MGKTQFITGLEENEEVDTVFSVKYKKPVREYSNGYTFTLGLSDKTGEIECKYWGGNNRGAVNKIFEEINTGDVIRVKGRVGTYREKKEVNIDPDTGFIKHVDNFDITDFVAAADRDPGDMLNELTDVIESLETVPLRKLLRSIVEDEQLAEELKQAPAAMFYHHNYIGGLLEHVLHMINLAETMVENKPGLNRDLLLTGCILHDLGKIREFTVDSNISQSKAGLLRGHVSIGEEIVLHHIKKQDGFPEELKNKILHMIIAHHGEKEYGAAKEPAFAEAAALHFIDTLDSQTFRYLATAADAETEDWHTWDKNLGQIYLE